MTLGGEVAQWRVDAVGDVDSRTITLIPTMLSFIHVLISDYLLISVVEPRRRRATTPEADVRVEFGDGQLGRACPLEGTLLRSPYSDDRCYALITFLAKCRR